MRSTSIVRRALVVGTALLLAAAVPSPSSAQRLGKGDSVQPAARRQLEQKFRQRFGEVIRDRLALNNGQMSRLESTNRRFEGQRRQLFVEERRVRQEMRDALGGAANPAAQDRVSRLMESAMRLQRQRLDLVEAEQRELSGYLTPVQRAKYFGMQEQLRRRMEEMRTRGDEGADSTTYSSDRARRRAARRTGVLPSDSSR